MGGRKDEKKKTYVERELIARERESCVLRRLWAEREIRKEGIESYSNLDAASFYCSNLFTHCLALSPISRVVVMFHTLPSFFPPLIL